MIETGVKAQDPADGTSLHDRQVDRIAGGEIRTRVQYVFRPLDVCPFDAVYLIDDPKERVERGLDGLQAPDREVAVQDLLHDLGIRHEALSFSNESLENAQGLGLVAMGRPDKVHGDVGIDEDHRPDDAP